MIKKGSVKQTTESLKRSSGHDIMFGNTIDKLYQPKYEAKKAHESTFDLFAAHYNKS